MKLKILFIVLISMFIFMCFSQMFNIYPYAKDVFPYYKSGYFKELDTQFDVIADVFVTMKMMTQAEKILPGTGAVTSSENQDPVYSWILLDDISKRHGIKIKVYDMNGNLIPVPGVKMENDSPDVLKIVNSFDPVPVSYVNNSYYNYYLPVKTGKECLICHKNTSEGRIAGVLVFSRKYNTLIYYSRERIILFSFLAFLSFILLFYVIRWDPEKNIKELFDKTE